MHLISIDWLTISVDCSNFAVPADLFCEKEDYGTKIFQDMFTISEDGLELAILTLKPRMKQMNKNLGLLKILNPILYKPDLQQIIYKLLDKLQLKVLGISRLDLCADFHSFNDYPDVQDFIRDFLAVKIWKIGQAKYKVAGKAAKAPSLPHFKRKGKSKDIEEIQSFKVIGKQSARHNFQYLRFGSNLSDVSAYLYNKTQEFIDVKRKNYIEEMWIEGGLNPAKTVWRLEFSLKGNGIKFLDKTSGECQQKSLEMILDEELRTQLFAACFNKYWIFRYNDGQVRKDRMKPVDMLTIGESIYHPIVIDCSDETTRENKRMISAIEKTYDEIRIKHQVRDLAIEASLDNLADFVKLSAWRQEKYGKKYSELDPLPLYTTFNDSDKTAVKTPTLFDN